MDRRVAREQAVQMALEQIDWANFDGDGSLCPEEQDIVEHCESLIRLEAAAEDAAAVLIQQSEAQKSDSTTTAGDEVPDVEIVYEVQSLPKKRRLSYKQPCNLYDETAGQIPRAPKQTYATFAAARGISVPALVNMLCLGIPLTILNVFFAFEKQLMPNAPRAGTHTMVEYFSGLKLEMLDHS